MLPALYTEYRFKIDPISAVVYPVFRQSTPLVDELDYRDYESLDVVQGGEQIAAAATEDAHLYLNTVHLWNARSLDNKRILTDPTMRFGSFIPVVDSGVNTLAAAGTPFTMRLLDMESGDVLPTISGADSFVNGIDVSLDGSQIVAAQWNEEAQRWRVNFIDAQTRQVVRFIEPRLKYLVDEIYEVALSPDGRLLAIALSHSVQIWSLENDTMLHTVSARPDISTLIVDTQSQPLTFSVDGSRLTIREIAGRLKQIDTANGKVLAERKDFCLDNVVAFSPSGSQYVCSDNTGRTTSTKIVSLESEEPPVPFEGFEIVDHSAFSADEKSLLVKNDDEEYFLYNLNDKKAEPITIAGLESGIDSMSFSRDRKTIFVQGASLRRAKDGTDRYVRPLIILDASTLKPISSLTLPQSRYQHKLHVSNQTIAIQQEQSVLNFWKITPVGIQHQHSLFSEEIGYPEAAVFSPDGETFAVLYRPEDEKVNRIAVGNVSSGQISQVMDVGEEDRQSIVFSPDGELLLTAYVNNVGQAGSARYSHQIELWNISTGEMAQRFDLLSSSENASNKGTLTRAIRSSPVSFALSDDGTLLLTRNEDAAYLWDVETGDRIRTLAQRNPNSPKKNPAVRSAAISHDNLWAAFADYDGKLSIWSLESGERLRALPLQSLPFAKGRTNGFHDLTFSSDRKMLFATADSQIIRWKLPSRLSLFNP